MPLIVKGKIKWKNGRARCPAFIFKGECLQVKRGEENLQAKSMKKKMLCFLQVLI